MSLGFTLWNMEDGFVDGLLRGWRSTFLSDTEYANLKEGGKRGGAGAGLAKEDFEDMRLALQETDYGTFLAAEPALDPKLIGLRATAKWVREMRYARASATGEWWQGRRTRCSLFLSRAPPCARRPSRLCRACACVHCTLSRVRSSPRVLSPRAPLGTLARFLDFVAYEYMIDNILDLIKAATSSASVDMQAVVENCHPLGMLEPAVMRSILAYEDLGEDFLALYRTILVDTPVGKYFTMFLQEAVDEKAAMDPDAVRSTFAEIPMTLIENSVKKFYLEDFFRFCKEEVGGETGCVPAPRLLRPPPPPTTPPLPPDVRPPSPCPRPHPCSLSPSTSFCARPARSWASCSLRARTC